MTKIEGVSGGMAGLPGLGDMEERLSKEAPPQDRGADEVSVSPASLRRLQASIEESGEEPISLDQAIQALAMVGQARPEELAQAHEPLDPARVRRLLGLAD